MATTKNVSFAWKRPPGPPRVWKRFEINEKTGSEGKDGKVLRFAIEEIPSDRYDEIVELMVNYFLADEPLSRCLNLKNDPDAIEDHRRIWRLYLREGISVGLFLDDPEVDKREIVGANVLLVRTREDKITYNEIKLKSARSRKIKEFIKSVRAGTSGLDIYKVDKCLIEFGLLVIPRFRGYSLGGHLLGIRNVIGREYKIPVTETVFTAPGSQILAMRNGFEVLVKKKYSEAYDSKGQLLFPNVRAEDVKIMGKRKSREEIRNLRRKKYRKRRRLEMDKNGDSKRPVQVTGSRKNERSESGRCLERYPHHPPTPTRRVQYF